MKRRAVSIVLTILAVLCLVAAVTDVDVSDCTVDVKTDSSAKKGTIPADATTLALQVHGGDSVFGNAVRERFRDEVKERRPQVTQIVEGPPPKGAVLVKSSLTAASIMWTPVWATADLGVQNIVRAGRNDEVVEEVRLLRTCRGLVSRSRFQAELPQMVGKSLADILSDALANALDPALRGG